MARNTLTIAEVDTRDGRLLDQFAATQAQAVKRRAYEIEQARYRSFQGLRDLLRAWLENEELVSTLSREQYEAARAELAEAERF